MSETASHTPVTISFIAESAGVSVPTVSKVINGRSGTIDTFEALKEDALTRGEVLGVPHRPGAGVGSLDPRA